MYVSWDTYVIVIEQMLGNDFTYEETMLLPLKIEMIFHFLTMSGSTVHFIKVRVVVYFS